MTCWGHCYTSCYDVKLFIFLEIFYFLRLFTVYVKLLNEALFLIRHLERSREISHFCWKQKWMYRRYIQKIKAKKSPTFVEDFTTKYLLFNFFCNCFCNCISYIFFKSGNNNIIFSNFVIRNHTCKSECCG